MSQDILSTIQKHHASLIEASDIVPLPIAIVDENCNQIWENQHLKENYPFLQGKTKVRSLLEGYDLDALILTLRTQPSSFSCPSRLPLVDTVLTFSPLYDQSQFLLGATVHFSISSTEMFPSDANHMQEMMKNFNTSLRDPLSSIFSGISTIAQRLEIDDTASCEGLLQQLHQNCYHMLKCCNSLSEYSSYANGLSMLNLNPVSLNVYLKDLFQHIQMMVRKNGIQMTYTLPEENCILNLDLDKLMIVLTSLISNSVAFIEDRPEGERLIHIKVTLSKSHIHFVVSDNGVGISPEVLPHIFEPYFTRGRNDLHFSHLGLGLTLSQMIVHHHQGEISVFSSEGQGTAVTFTLSRNLENTDSHELTFRDNPAEYIVNSYSPMYIYLSDVCEWILP